MKLKQEFIGFYERDILPDQPGVYVTKQVLGLRPYTLIYRKLAVIGALNDDYWLTILYNSTNISHEPHELEFVLIELNRDYREKEDSKLEFLTHVTDEFNNIVGGVFINVNYEKAV